MPAKPTDSASSTADATEGFARLLAPGRVLCNVEARSQKHAFEIISELLASADHGIGASEIFDSLVQRERLGGTGLGKGVALPHARAAELEQSVGAVLLLREAIPFDAPDGEDVRIVFGMLVPEEANEEHLGNLAGVARRLLQPGFVQALLGAGSSSALYDLFDAADERSAGERIASSGANAHGARQDIPR
jgi:PTS system nitrogen regulatory IIA component